MSELEKELIKHSLLHPRNDNKQSNFVEILGILVFCFMVMMYFNNQPVNKTGTVNHYHIQQIPVDQRLYESRDTSNNSNCVDATVAGRVYISTESPSLKNATFGATSMRQPTYYPQKINNFNKLMPY